MKNLWKLIKLMLGFPPAANDEQRAERLITMREDRDCLVAAIATLLGISYEAAYKLLWHFNLPFFLESPILANPLNAVRAIRAAGWQANDKVKISELLKGEMEPGKVLCLVHNPAGFFQGILGQHWVVYMGMNAPGEYLFHWGQKQSLKVLTQAELVDMLTAGWPNCIISVSK